MAVPNVKIVKAKKSKQTSKRTTPNFLFALLMPRQTPDRVDEQWKEK
jgi:hypothetical protein